MPIINITPEIIEASKPWGAGWHKATIVEFLEAPSAKKDSMNFKPIYEYGWSSDGTSISGKRLSEFAHLMNNKNPGAFARNFLPFVAAVMDIPVSQVEPGAFDTDKCKGKEVWIEVVEETYNGNLNEKVQTIVSRSKVPF